MAYFTLDKSSLGWGIIDLDKKKTNTEKEFEIDGEKVKDLVEESKKRKLVFLDKKGETIMSMVLLWAIIISVIFWPLVLVGAVVVLASGGSVRIGK